jgi:guanylate kinase
VLKSDIKNIDYYAQNIVLVVSGTMASGKDTVLKLFQNGTDFYFIKSFASRPKRRNEKNGDPYEFVSQGKFRKMIEREELWEYEELYGNFYGITKNEILKALISGKPIVFRVDERGVFKIKKVFSKTKTIFIAPPSLKTIKERIINRVNTPNLLKNERLESARIQLLALTGANIYDYVIINKDSMESVKELKQIFRSLIKK